MKYLALILCLLFTGCGINPVKPEPPVIKETKYIVKVPPADLVTFPDAVKDIDVDKATQKEASSWLIDKEAYTVSLENKIIEMAIFFKTEQEKLDAEAAKSNPPKKK